MNATETKPVSYYKDAVAYVNGLAGDEYEFGCKQLDYWTQGGHQPLSGDSVTSRRAGEIMDQIKCLARLGM